MNDNEEQAEKESIIQAQQAADSAYSNAGRGNDRAALARAKEILSEGGIDMEEGEIESLRGETPETPSFPMFMLGLAIIKDILDGVLTATIVLGIFSLLYAPFYLLANFIWLSLKENKIPFLEKMLIRMLLRRILTVSVLEAIPYINAIPFSTIFVFLNHYSETKMVKLFRKAAKELEGVR